jgi:protocatechuate 3,4-dioxygenase beta subunit/uncharacterized protein YuzE
MSFITRQARRIFVPVVAASALGATMFVTGGVASAVTQNGYAFNDAWTLGTLANTANTPTAYATQATNRATTQIPLSTGTVGLTATFTPGSGEVAGTNFLSAGTNQGAYAAADTMLTGRPAPASLPALGVVTNASRCAGALGSAAHQNFSGICEGVGEITFTFDRPVTNPLLDLTGVGGWGGFRHLDGWAKGSYSSTIWNITTPGVTFTDLSSGATTLEIAEAGKQVKVSANNAMPRCDDEGKQPVVQESPEARFPKAKAAGCGTVVLDGTFTTVTFRLDAWVTPASEFTAAASDTGPWFFLNEDGTETKDGINGYNMVFGEKLRGADRRDVSLNDLQRVSVRLPEPAALGNLAFFDADGDGTYGTGDSPLAGVQVGLEQLIDGVWVPATDVSGETVAPVTTTDTGLYRFTNLVPGRDYRVTFAAPTGYGYTTVGSSDVQTATNAVDDDSNAIATTGNQAHSPTVVLAPGATNNTIDAGLVLLPAAVGDRVWLDLDRDGIQDAGEPGVEGVTVRLLDEAGNVVDTTTTDSSGNYRFDGVSPGTYTVQFDHSTATTAGIAGYSPVDRGGDDALDSDATPYPSAPTYAETPAFTLAPGQENLTLDAGLVLQTASVGDRVWLDRDRDGVQDAGEPGVAGVTVQLLDADGNVVGTTTTDGNGNYLFTGLEPGSYSVRFDHSTATTAGIAGYAPGGAGTDPLVDSDVTTTSGTTGTTAAFTLAPGDAKRDVDAGVVLQTASVGDRVWLDRDRDGIQDAGEPGVAGVTVQLLDGDGNVVATRVTDSNGNYLFTGLEPGSYSVRFDHSTATTAGIAGYAPGGAGTDPLVDSDVATTSGTTGTTAAFTLAPGDAKRDVDAGVVLQTASIGDRVWLDRDRDGVQDAGEPGVAGVTVQLLDADGNVVGTTTTDGSGNYLFTGLEPGSYSVRFDHSTATTAGIAGYAPGGAGTDPLVDSDVATTSGTTGTTAAFTLAPGDAKRDVDAGVVLQTASIGDRVWLDRDRDGIQDDGEPGVAGVTVQLLDGDGNVVATRVTDSNGNYLFDDIEPGTYTVRFDHSTSSITGIRGWSPTGAGTADTDSDASPTGVTGPITVAAGDAIRNVDAGITLLLGSVSGRIYEDVDEGYGYDDGEAPFAGLTIQLIDKDGNVVAETTTGADGTYRFDDVEPGDYTIKIVDPPAGRVFETPGPVTVVAGEESVNHNSGFHVVIPVVTVPPTTSTVPSTTSTVPATTPTTSTPGQVSGNGSTSRPANSTPSSVATRALARTGAETRSLAVIGGLMTVIGGAVVIVTRRRAL